jgi:hypothetical protein
MAYGENQHDAFARRATNWMRQAQAMYEEFKRLDGIYINETASGTDAAWTDHSLATEAELVDFVTFGRTYCAFVDGSAAVSQLDRRSNMTPFLQGE